MCAASLIPVALFSPCNLWIMSAQSGDHIHPGGPCGPMQAAVQEVPKDQHPRPLDSNYQICTPPLCPAAEPELFEQCDQPHGGWCTLPT